MYFGDIGQDSIILLSYFRRNGADCPADANPAEWMLDAIGAGQSRHIGNRDWVEFWRESPEREQAKREIIEIKSRRVEEARQTQATYSADKEYATPLWHQIKTVCKRTNIVFWRSHKYGFTRLFTHFSISLITGLAYLQLDDSRASLQYRIFVLFNVTVIPIIIIQMVEPRYEMSRLVFYREAASKTYKDFAFAMSMVIAEIPYCIICAVIFFVFLFYIPGFQSASDRAGYQFLMVMLTQLFAVTLGQMVQALTPNSMIASQFNPPLMILFSLFCGVMIPKPQMPGFWRAWFYELDPFTRIISGMVTTELHGRSVTCTPGEFNRFQAPVDQTCGEYMQAFFDRGGIGYLANNATQDCEYCAYQIGDEYYQAFEMNFDNRWRDLGIYAAFVGSNLIILFLAVSLPPSLQDHLADSGRRVT